jgi:AsmA protein
MTRRVRIVAIVLGVLVVGGLVLPRLVNVDSFRPKLEAELSAALNREVKIGSLSLSIFSGTVSADNISIADDPAFSKEPFLTAKLFKAGVKGMPLVFSKTLHVTGITLDEPQIALLRGSGSTWNFSSIGKTAAADVTNAEQAEESGNALSVDKLSVEKGRLPVGNANSGEKPAVYDKVGVQVSNFSATTQFPFTLTAALPDGGDFSLKGKCGPVNPANTAATSLGASMKVGKLDLAAPGSVAASMGIEGLTDFDGVIQSDGRQLKTSGSLETQKLKLARKARL